MDAEKRKITPQGILRKLPRFCDLHCDAHRDSALFVFSAFIASLRFNSSSRIRPDKNENMGENLRRLKKLPWIAGQPHGIKF